MAASALSAAAAAVGIRWYRPDDALAWCCSPPPRSSRWSATSCSSASTAPPLGRRHLLPRAVSESWFATVKNELIYTRAWPTLAGLRPAVFEYIEGWYNTWRLHSSLGYRSPAEYEATVHQETTARAA